MSILNAIRMPAFIISDDPGRTSKQLDSYIEVVIVIIDHWTGRVLHSTKLEVLYKIAIVIYVAGCFSRQSSLVIKCPSEGCGWTGELRNKEVA